MGFAAFLDDLQKKFLKGGAGIYIKDDRKKNEGIIIDKDDSFANVVGKAAKNTQATWVKQ